MMVADWVRHRLPSGHPFRAYAALADLPSAHGDCSPTYSVRCVSIHAAATETAVAQFEGQSK